MSQINDRTWPEPYVSLATGNRVSKNFGFVTILDMAWAMGRICRWTGSGSSFFSDLLHSFVVADLVPNRLKCHALIHDSPECATNDSPSPIKDSQRKATEDAIMERTLAGLGLPRLNAADKAIIKRADNRAAAGEAWTVGNAGNRISYPERDLFAEALVRKYLKEFPYATTIEKDGSGPAQFVLRYHEYFLLHQLSFYGGLQGLRDSQEPFSLEGRDR